MVKINIRGIINDQKFIGCENRYTKRSGLRVFSKHLRLKYKMSLEEYYSKLKNQFFVCEICGNKNGKNRLVVDHNHYTGAVRGLLCNKCNTVLGLFENNNNLVNKMVDYLKKYNLPIDK